MNSRGIASAVAESHEEWKTWFHYFCSLKIVHSNGKTDTYLNG
jgi:hypothetical protein